MVGKSVTFKDRTVVGLTENIIIIGGVKTKTIARIDSGATKSSIDSLFASELKLGPVLETKMVKSASGNKMRPVIEAKIKIKGKEIQARFTLADRSHMKFKVLIGQNILKENFLIDPMKK
ncbi:MAG: RimK/LysX family protein [Nanoarchaeota archaeon]|nr:RimK/LysX family protein [Nanoarchaeota archaeon]MBU1704444.1 RimK/LysX family protein [Nanoarchaeota archaeon]